MSSAVIVGASCESGLALAQLLKDLGDDVFAVVRSASKGRALVSMGCKLCVADAVDLDNLQSSLRMVPADAQFISFLGGHQADGSRLPLRTYNNVVDVAKIARASRFTLISTVGCGESAGAVLWVFHQILKDALKVREQAEEYLRTSGLPWSVIRPGALPTRMPPTGQGVLVEDPHVMGAIHRFDLANIVFRAQQSHQTLGKNLTAVDPTRIWKPFCGQVDILLS